MFFQGKVFTREIFGCSLEILAVFFFSFVCVPAHCPIRLRSIVVHVQCVLKKILVLKIKTCVKLSKEHRVRSCMSRARLVCFCPF